MKLVLLGDFHYSCKSEDTDGINAARDRFFAEMINRFLRIEADYHISLGDLTNEGSRCELEFVRNAVSAYPGKRDFIHILGNHDTIAAPKAEILRITAQPRYKAIQAESAVLIFLDTNKEMNVEDFGGVMDAEQYSWLEQQIALSGTKPVFVFGHHPVPGTTRLSDLPMHGMDPQHDLWPALSKKQGQGYYFCGHNHINSIATREQWHFVQTAAFLDLLSVRVVEVKDGKLAVSMQNLADDADRAVADKIASRMTHFKPTPHAEGALSDRCLELAFGHE